jgi:hypothetical protein
MSATPERLLWDALVLPLPQAGDAWRRWRASADLDHLDPASFHLLPALAARMPAWIGDDPKQAVLLGICRRAWSQNQLRRQLLAQALEVLTAAGIDRVAATGPLLWAEQYWPEGAIRPVGSVDLLMEPASVRAALHAMSTAGWIVVDPVPAGNQFHFAPGVRLRSSEGDEVRVHWRALPNTDFSLRRPEPPPLQKPGAIPREYSLVAALGGDLQDAVGWQYDALMICATGLDWKPVAALLRPRSVARTRLDRLRREWSAEIPPWVTRPVWWNGIERILASALRIYRRRRAVRS